MPRSSEIPEEVAQFAEAQVAAGRFRSVGDVLRASIEALEERDAHEAKVKELRAAWDKGMASMSRHGPQLESDEDFEAFLDEAAADALRR